MESGFLQTTCDPGHARKVSGDLQETLWGVAEIQASTCRWTWRVRICRNLAQISVERILRYGHGEAVQAVEKSVFFLQCFHDLSDAEVASTTAGQVTGAAKDVLDILETTAEEDGEITEATHVTELFLAGWRAKQSWYAERTWTPGRLVTIRGIKSSWCVRVFGGMCGWCVYVGGVDVRLVLMCCLF